MPFFIIRLVNRLQRWARRFARFPFLAGLIAAIIAMIIARYAPEPEPGLDNQSVAGAWILQINNQAQLSCVLDGNGAVSTASNFFNNGGNYNVSANGDFSMQWNQSDASAINFSGHFDSDSGGTFNQPSNGDLVKVSDRSAMSGLWYARYEQTVGNNQSYNGTFTADTDGSITSSSGDLSLTGGTIFIENGGVVMHAATTRSDAWIEVDCTGTGDVQTVTGTLTLDSAFGSDGTFIFQRDPFFGVADVAGTWLMRNNSSPQLYAVLDGNGNVSTASNFFNDGGSYTVAANGDFNLQLGETGASDIAFTGNFSDANAGTLSTPITGSLERVDDPSAMSGLWYATWHRSVNDDTSYSGTFTVDNTGAITASTGQLTLTGGYIFIANGGVVMHAATNRSDAWVEVDCRGTGNTQNVSGSMSLDTANNYDGSFTFTRTLNLNKAAVAGPWLLQINGQAEQYVIFDGVGTVEASNFFNNGGTYNVGGSSLVMQWFQDFGGPLAFTGTFTSATTATVSGPASGSLIKVSDPGALAGTWGGDLNKNTQTPTTRSLNFTVASNGQITSSTGDLSVTHGYAFLENGQVVIHAETSNTDAWSEFHCFGTGNASTLSGSMGVDSPFDIDGNFLFTNPPPANN